MKKKLIILFFAALLPLSSLAAQQQGAFTLLSFDIGQGIIAYDFSAEENLRHTFFALNVRVADPLIISIATKKFDGADSGFGLKLKYDVLPFVRAVIGYGWDAHSLIGFEAVPFRRQVGGVFTEFKLVTNYMFPQESVGDGKFLLGLALGIGF
ncbi:MAG: hypothetical protein FWC36_01870 [Spirochaetes bacterium]|nr:hypothetical protein [Spirochaetota bacterium]